MVLALSYNPYSFRAECSTGEEGNLKKINSKNDKIKNYIENCFIFETCIAEFLDELHKDEYLKDKIEFTGTKQDFDLLSSICKERYEDVECILVNSLGDLNPFTKETMEEIIQASSITASAIAVGKEKPEFLDNVTDELVSFLESAKMEDSVKSMVLYNNAKIIFKELKLPEEELANVYNKASFSKSDGMTFEDLKKFNEDVNANTESGERDLTLDIVNSAGYLFAKFNIGTLMIFENAVDFAVGGVARLFKNKKVGETLFKNQLTKRASKALDEHMDVPDKVKVAGHYVEFAGDAASKIGLTLLGTVGPVGAIVSGTFLGLGSAGETVKKAAEKTGEYGDKEYLCGLAVGVIAGTLPAIIGGISSYFSKISATLTEKAVNKVVVEGGKAAAVKAAQFGVGLGAATAVGATAGLLYEVKDITEEVLFKTAGVKDKIEIDLKKIAVNLAIGIGISCACYMICAIPTLTKDNKELQNSIDAYRKEILEGSEYPETVGSFSAKDTVRSTSDQVAEKREAFSYKKRDLRDEWELLHNKEWPRYKEDVIVDGKIRHFKGDRYDAHHIQPLCLGGENTAQNITPLDSIVHSNLHTAVGSEYSTMVGLKEAMQAPDYLAKFANKGVEAMAAEFGKGAITK